MNQTPRQRQVAHFVAVFELFETEPEAWVSLALIRSQKLACAGAAHDWREYAVSAQRIQEDSQLNEAELMRGLDALTRAGHIRRNHRSSGVVTYAWNRDWEPGFEVPRLDCRDDDRPRRSRCPGPPFQG